MSPEELVSRIYALISAAQTDHPLVASVLCQLLAATISGRLEQLSDVCTAYAVQAILEMESKEVPS